MSHVCNVIVMSQAWLTPPIEVVLDRVWTATERTDLRPQLVESSGIGGNRGLEVDLLIGAHNYLDIERFLRALHAELIRQDVPGHFMGSNAECVQVAIQDQHDNRFTLYRMDELGNHFDMGDE